jgi:hypothetical protein
MNNLMAILHLLAVGIWMTSVNAYAQSDDCNAIKDTDKQNYCKATTSGKPDFCSKISNNDTRNLCLAKVHNKESYCRGISTARVKERCLQSIR